MNEETYSPRYNAQPGAVLPVVRTAAPGEVGRIEPGKGASSYQKPKCSRVVESMRWGLVPSFTGRDATPDFFKMFNARGETLAEKGVFSRLLSHHRGVVLLDGFYEWAAEGGRGRDAVKQPYYLHISSDDEGKTGSKGEDAVEGNDADDRETKHVLRCAALYDTWHRSDGTRMTTCTIITVPAAKSISWLHDRMPAVLRTDEEVDAWLHGGTGGHREGKDNGGGAAEPLRLLRPYGADDLRWHPVTTAMSKPEFEGPECCKRAKRKVEENVGSVAALFARAREAPLGAVKGERAGGSDGAGNVSILGGGCSGGVGQARKRLHDKPPSSSPTAKRANTSPAAAGRRAAGVGRGGGDGSQKSLLSFFKK